MHSLGVEKAQKPYEVAPAHPHRIRSTPQGIATEALIPAQDRLKGWRNWHGTLHALATLITAMEMELGQDTHDGPDQPLARSPAG
jgi:hypothetical protein